ncbi:inactive peptidyl-prolyl cis-trans isomerase FKBP6 isoform X2 [Erpetoichthys calabaricus]|uniref:inactive peptidyl-prolyl cis-trans isomerase FKBP6 isoform X2 n=1 Tax=Erpetoichthys calabaricus TaxID=27687 RepID=UPI002234490E|nr:inactive peptidyl-prolyl cis-trans isomerase FKBP6 isoform X2 [Erpetoichthys calabaricus]
MNGDTARLRQFLTPRDDGWRCSMMSPYQRLARQMQDISGDGGVLKKLLKDGTGQMVPRNASVSVLFSGFLEYSDQPFTTNVNMRKPRMMKLGEDITLLGLQIALLTMKQGEFSRFLFHPKYAYGELGCPPVIPPSATLLFEVHLLEFLDSAEIDEFFDLSQGEQQNVPFSKMLKAVTVLLDHKISCELEQHKVDRRKLLLFLNLSVTYLRLICPTKALRYGKMALTIDARNAKALFRCGQASLDLGDIESAKNFLIMAQTEKPFDPDINALLKNVVSCHREYAEKEKEMCVRMFPK